MIREWPTFWATLTLYNVICDLLKPAVFIRSPATSIFRHRPEVFLHYPYGVSKYCLSATRTNQLACIGHQCNMCSLTFLLFQPFYWNGTVAAFRLLSAPHAVTQRLVVFQMDRNIIFLYLVMNEKDTDWYKYMCMLFRLKSKINSCGQNSRHYYR